MMEKNTIYFGVLAMILVFVGISFFSTDIGEWFTGITAEAVQQDTNASITVTGINSVKVSIINNSLTGPQVDPTENSFAPITFNVHLKDPDGVADLNDTSVRANFTRSGESLRQNSSCIHKNDIDSTRANYSCTINMWYFDGSGAWTITASGTDLGNKTFIHNSSASFQFDQLQAIAISPSSIGWASASPGGSKSNIK